MAAPVNGPMAPCPDNLQSESGWLKSTQNTLSVVGAAAKRGVPRVIVPKSSTAPAGKSNFLISRHSGSWLEGVRQSAICSRPTASTLLPSAVNQADNVLTAGAKLSSRKLDNPNNRRPS